jgi:hypothetical protein
MNVRMQVSLLFIHCVAVKSPLVLTGISTCLIFTVLRLRSTGMPFVFCLTVSQQLISLLWRWESSVHYDFGGCCVWGTGPLWTLFPSSEMLTASMLSRALALEGAVYLPCDCGCGASKTSSQHSSSCVPTVSHCDSSLSQSIIDSDSWSEFSRQALLLLAS